MTKAPIINRGGWMVSIGSGGLDKTKITIGKFAGNFGRCAEGRKPLARFGTDRHVGRKGLAIPHEWWETIKKNDQWGQITFKPRVTCPKFSFSPTVVSLTLYPF